MAKQQESLFSGHSKKKNTCLYWKWINSIKIYVKRNLELEGIHDYWNPIEGQNRTLFKSLGEHAKAKIIAIEKFYKA